MITSSCSVEVKSIEEAPNYNQKPFAHFKPARVTSVVIVKKGMKSGMPSFDIQVEDKTGDSYIIQMSGNIFRSIAKIAELHYPREETPPVIQ